MKIGIDIRLIGKKQTGSEVVFFNLVKNLAVIDQKNDYILFTDTTNQETIKKIKEDLEINDKINFFVISLSTGNKFIWNFWTLQRYLRKNPVDMYLTQYITPFFVPKKIKILTIIHDISFKVYKQFIKKSDLFFLSTLIPWSLRRADKILGVSKFTADEIIKYYHVMPEKTAWFHNSVSQDYLAQDVREEKIRKVKEKYNLPEEYILYIGTMQPRKNISTLVEAFSKIDNSDIKLVLAGGRGHNLDKKIDETIVRNNLQNDVIFPGFVDEEDKAALMKGAMIFAFPSFYEGFGIPILEAFAVGTPVIASNIAPHLEISDDAAMFFDPNNAGDLAKKLNEMINDRNRRIEYSQKGTEQVKKFSWEKTARKLLEIFEGMK
ncbi:MAG TPA: glycosyltransferase family 1 protein [Patescibacteria group bacterium]|nr:glycosyltransferase family 1 protein [Patescibacteria group bacterium]